MHLWDRGGESWCMAETAWQIQLKISTIVAVLMAFSCELMYSARLMVHKSRTIYASCSCPLLPVNAAALHLYHSIRLSILFSHCNGRVCIIWLKISDFTTQYILQWHWHLACKCWLCSHKSFFLASVKVSTQNRENDQIWGLSKQHHPSLYLSSNETATATWSMA